MWTSAGICKDSGKALAVTLKVTCSNKKFKYLYANFRCSTKIEGIVCGKEFLTAEETTAHKKMHTTCSVCDIDFVFVSKLKTHMKIH